MYVAEILRTKGEAVFTTTPDASVAEASAQLADKGVGALIVCEGDQVVGVLSERDIVRAIAADGQACLTRPVSGYMTGEVIFATPTETIDMLMTRMTDRRIRHLPVLRDRRLSGVISIGDVVKSKIAEATHEAEELKAYIVSG